MKYIKIFPPFSKIDRIYDNLYYHHSFEKNHYHTLILILLGCLVVYLNFIKKIIHKIKNILYSKEIKYIKNELRSPISGFKHMRYIKQLVRKDGYILKNEEISEKEYIQYIRKEKLNNILK